MNFLLAHESAILLLDLAIYWQPRCSIRFATAKETAH